MESRYQVCFEDITGCFHVVVVLGHEEDPPEVAGEAEGQHHGDN
jgi:hypothetical protein